MFQSPRSGKFVSDERYNAQKSLSFSWFQSPRSGKFVSDVNVNRYYLMVLIDVSIP